MPTDSFFNFFSPPTLPEDDEEEVDEDIDEKLELDYQIGEDLKERVSAGTLGRTCSKQPLNCLNLQVIPRAISFFDGSINRAEPDFSDSDEFDEDSDEDEEDSDEEGLGGSRRAPAPPSGNTPGSHQDPQE